MSFLRGVMKKTGVTGHKDDAGKENGQPALHGNDAKPSSDATTLWGTPVVTNGGCVANGKQQNGGVGNGHDGVGKPQQPPSQTQQQPQIVPVTRPKLQFHCQLAHGSPTGILAGFSNVKELYQMIASCYNLPVSEILFCTLNTHKVDMNKLLGGQIALDDFIFAHKKGQAKEIEITKIDDALGLTITDNGAGYAFIKRIRDESVIDKIKLIQVGDHLERINDKSLIGCRHFEVAKMLKDIPKGTNFVIRLIEPLRAGFANIGPRTDPRGTKKPGYGSGKETLRLRANAPATVQEAPDDVVESAISKINSLLENFLGINDSDLGCLSSTPKCHYNDEELDPRVAGFAPGEDQVWFWSLMMTVVAYDDHRLLRP
ncbi:unnamed protein product, partial [Notodromas monacha]